MNQFTGIFILPIIISTLSYLNKDKKYKKSEKDSLDLIVWMIR